MFNKLLIIGFVYPEPTSSAAGSRMLQLIEAFKTLGYQITFSSTSQKTDNSFRLDTLSIQEVPIELNSPSFDVFIKELQPHVVLFDRFMTEEQFGWRVAENCPKALRVLDTEDLHCLRKGREQAFFEGNKFTDEYVFNEFAKREIASIYRCDLSLIISAFEMELLKRHFKVPSELLLYLPFMEEPIDEEAQRNVPGFSERNHFVTVGTFKHEPNLQSVLYLKQVVWKLIREKLPQAELHIYGAHVTQKVRQLHNDQEGFLIKGYVGDIGATLKKYRVCLAPLQFGAGLKGKLIDAMKSGTPCVMSNIAAEGMFGQLPVPGFVEDDAEIFSEKAVEMFTIDKIYNNHQINGFQIINILYDKYYFNKILSENIVSVHSILSEHRLKNFIGSMFQYHTLQSSKYMSKWIEEKNK